MDIFHHFEFRCGYFGLFFIILFISIVVIISIVLIIDNEDNRCHILTLTSTFSSRDFFRIFGSLPLFISEI